MYAVCTQLGESGSEAVSVTTAVAGRLNFRVPADVERQLRSAAESTSQSLTDFVLGAAQERAEEVLATRTVVPPDYFEHLLSALDEPVGAMPELKRAAKRRRQFVQR